jgi:hypothetical protein
VIVISKQLSHIYFKKWDNESDFAFCNPKKVYKLFKYLRFPYGFIKCFLRKRKIFPKKKHSLCRKLFFEIEDPGRGDVEAWVDSKKPWLLLQKINTKFRFASV